MERIRVGWPEEILDLALDRNEYNFAHAPEVLEAVRNAFEKLGPYVGAGAPYDFSPERHVGITKNPYVIAYVKDGKLVARPKGVLTAPHFPGWPEHPHRPGLSGRI